MDDSKDYRTSQIKFIDDTNTNIISIRKESIVRIWDVAIGTHMGEMGGEHFVWTKGISDKQTVGKYVIDTKDNLVCVRERVNLDQGTLNIKIVACFFAPSHIETLQCSGNNIRLECKEGEVLHLQMSFLTA